MEAIEKLREMDRGNLIPYGNGDYRPDTRHGQIADEIEREIAELQECWAQEAREHADDSAILAELAHENAELKREIIEKYMVLPADRNGETLRIGDEVWFHDEPDADPYIVRGYGMTNGYDVDVYINHADEGWCPSTVTVPDVLVHHKPDPYKELLVEFAYRLCDMSVADGDLRRYADKFRELGKAGA